MGTVIGASLGSMFAILVTMILLGHHHAKNTDYVLFDAGWQFQMALTSPLDVDAGQVASAATTPTH